MEVQLEPVKQASFEQHGPWHFRDVRFGRDGHGALDTTALLQAASIPALNGRLCEIKTPGGSHGLVRPDEGHAGSRSPKFTVRTPAGSVPATNTGPSPKPLAAPATRAAPSESAAAAAVPASPAALRFGVISTPGKKILTFPLRPPPPPPPKRSLKRRRPATDVDGHNTAWLGCKKRRLLRHMATSRLSQPFSHPATHIVRRESAVANDKRVLRLVAIVAARRLTGQPASPAPPQPSPSSLLLRMAVWNSYNQRVRPQGAETQGKDGGNSNIRATWQAPGPGAAVARFPVGLGSPAPVTPGPSTPCLGQPGVWPPAAAVQRAPPSASPSTPGPSSAEGASPQPSPRRRLVPSPRLRPIRSPELRSMRIPLDDVDDLDNDNVAFPTSEHESRYEDEPEEVYSDFSLLFGGGEGDPLDEEGVDNNFEDYLDEVDGIPWNARC